MNTDRSDALLKQFRERPFRAIRKVIEMRQVFPAKAEEVFIQLCPTREADWIPGWDCELIYTESGYAEEHCVFRTDEACVSGPGVWVMSHVEPPRLLDIVRFLPAMVVNLNIILSERPNGMTEGTWRIVLTGLDEGGNALIEQVPENAYDGLLHTLVHFLETGEMIEAPTYPAHHAHRFGMGHRALGDRIKQHLHG
jgi:hypothetical protein